LCHEVKRKHWALNNSQQPAAVWWLCHEVKRKALGTQRGTTINLQQVDGCAMKLRGNTGHSIILNNLQQFGGCAMKLKGKHWALSVAQPSTCNRLVVVP